MPKYTVQDTTSGKTVTFDWNGTVEPTESDMEEVFSGAGLREQKPQWQPTNDNSYNNTLPRPPISAGYGQRVINETNAPLGQIGQGVRQIARMQDPREVATGIQNAGQGILGALMTPLNFANSGIKQATGLDVMGGLISPISMAVSGYEQGFDRLGNAMFGQSDKEKMQAETNRAIMDRLQNIRYTKERLPVGLRNFATQKWNELLQEDITPNPMFSNNDMTPQGLKDRFYNQQLANTTHNTNVLAGGALAGAGLQQAYIPKGGNVAQGISGNVSESGNMLQQKGKYIPSKTASSIDWLTNMLERSAVKPSTSSRFTYDQTKDIVNTIKRENLAPTDFGIEKTKGLINDLNLSSQGLRDNLTKSGVTVDFNGLKTFLEDSKGRYKNSAVAKENIQAIDDMIGRVDAMANKYRAGQVPLNDAWEFKRSLQEEAAKAYGDKAPTINEEVARNSASAILNDIVAKAPELREIGFKQRDLINVQGVLEHRVRQLGNQDMLSVGKISNILTGGLTSPTGKHYSAVAIDWTARKLGKDPLLPVYPVSEPLPPRRLPAPNQSSYVEPQTLGIPRVTDGNDISYGNYVAKALHDSQMPFGEAQNYGNRVSRGEGFSQAEIEYIGRHNPKIAKQLDEINREAAQDLYDNQYIPQGEGWGTSNANSDYYSSTPNDISIVGQQGFMQPQGVDLNVNTGRTSMYRPPLQLESGMRGDVGTMRQNINKANPFPKKYEQTGIPPFEMPNSGGNMPKKNYVSGQTVGGIIRLPSESRGKWQPPPDYISKHVTVGNVVHNAHPSSIKQVLVENIPTTDVKIVQGVGFEGDILAVNSKGHIVGKYHSGKGDLGHLVVSPEYQNKGIGNALLQSADRVGLKIEVPEEKYLSPEGAKALNKFFSAKKK